MSAPRAADLPVGSVVAHPGTAWIKTAVAANELGSWLCTGDDMSTQDWEPQEALDAGAQVLRVGDGTGR